MSKYLCPGCRSEKLLVYAATAYEVNTGDFYCHASKTHDSDADASCLDCNWRGQRMDLITDSEVDAL